MATVPYNPVPDVAERPTPIGRVSVDANADMFGGAVGRALSQFGSTVEGSSNEIFARAMAMQQMKNEADANAASAAFDKQAGLASARFDTQRGINAGPDALAAHQKELSDLRDQIGSTLDSPAAQKLYQNNSLGQMGRYIVYAGRHSGQEMKGYYQGGLQAQLGQNADAALARPDDDMAFKASVANTSQLVQNLGASEGWSPDKINQTIAEQQSKLYSQRITGLARANPLAAQQMFKTALSDGSLRGEDIAGVQRTVEGQLISGGSKQIADAQRDGSTYSFGKGQVPIERAANAIAGIESGGNYQALGKMTSQGQALGKYQVMPNNLPQWLSQAGLPQMTPQQFLANPAAQDKVFATQFGKLMQQYGNANDAASAWLTGRPMAKAGNAADANGTTAQAYVSQFNANLAKSASLGEKVAVGRQQAQETDPSLPLLPDATEQRIIAQDREDNRVAREGQRQTQNVLDTALAAVPGKTPGTFDQFVHSNPQLSQAYEALDGAGKLKMQRQYNTVLASDNIPSPARDAQRQQLLGMATNDPEKFLDTDLYHGADLTANDRKVLVGVRDKMLSGSTSEPHLHVAMGLMQTQLDAAGLNRKDDQEGYDKYTGALADQLRVFQSAQGRQPNANEVREIGTKLLTGQAASKGWLWNSEDALYKAVPPDDFTARVKQRYPTATDDQVRRAYIQQQYNALAARK